jgi:hypothetical protein
MLIGLSIKNMRLENNGKNENTRHHFEKIKAKLCRKPSNNNAGTATGHSSLSRSE